MLHCFTATRTKSGAGIWTLSGLNTYNGTTLVNADTLNLDFSANSSPTTAINIIKSGNTINLGGRVLLIKGGGTGASNTQTFGTTALTADTASTINVNSNGGTVSLVLGTLTYGAKSTVDITLGGANVTACITTLATNGVLTSAATAARRSPRSRRDGVRLQCKALTRRETLRPDGCLPS